MKKILFLLPALLAARAPLPAQSRLVHPKVQATLEGNAASPLPFDPENPYYRKARYLQVDDLRPSRNLRILGIALRPDGTMVRPWKAFQAEVELRFSTARRRSSLVNAWFDANQGKDLTTVIARKTFKFPASSGVGRLPSPFLFTLPFDGGKSFLLEKGKEACWDLKLFRTEVPPRTGSFFLDAVSRGRSLFTRVLAPGGICPQRHGRLTLTLFYDFYQGRPRIHIDMMNGPPKGTAFLFLATRRLAQGVPFGSWGSLFHLDLRGAFAVLGPYRDPLGFGDFLVCHLFPPGTSSAPLGMSFFAQGVVVGTKAGEMGGTDFLECLFTPSWIQGIPGTGSVYISGRDALISPTGEAKPDRGLVVEYTYR